MSRLSDAYDLAREQDNLEDDIDYSDIPALTSKQLKNSKRTRVGRPLLGASPRKAVSIKIDPSLLKKIKVRAKSSGKRYQSLIHEVLEKFFNKAN